MHAEGILAGTTEILVTESQHPANEIAVVLAFGVFFHDRMVVEQFQGNLPVSTLIAHQPFVWQAVLAAARQRCCGVIGGTMTKSTKLD